MYCEKCYVGVDVIYNPFQELSSHGPDIENSDEKFYENDIYDIVDDFKSISNILNSCKSLHTIPDLNTYIQSYYTEIESNNFSTMFLNIDGNKSNFDSFAADIEDIDHKFSIIGLAETNIEPTNKDLYMLDEYNSFYQETCPGKS